MNHGQMDEERQLAGRKSQAAFGTSLTLTGKDGPDIEGFAMCRILKQNKF